MVAKKNQKAKFLIGIDEAGRGSLAGPVAIGLVAWAIDDWPIIKKFLRDYPVGKDSKKLTPKQRDFWFGKVQELNISQLAKNKVSLVSNKVVDKEGINFAVNQGIKTCLDSCEVAFGARLSAQALVLLDGGLKSPPEWVYQETIIRGDEKELIISLASIVAKVSRDRHMTKVGKKYSQYDFSRHKGYGTKLHCQTIKKFGPCSIHRRSYLSGLLFD